MYGQGENGSASEVVVQGSSKTGEKRRRRQDVLEGSSFPGTRTNVTGRDGCAPGVRKNLNIMQFFNCLS